MITTKLYGGLGNNLFQMATCIAYSLKHNVPYCIPTKVDNPHYPEQKPYIFPGVNYCDKELNLPIYREKSFTYEEIPFMEDACLSGYWQSEKYFSEYREEILKSFGFGWAILEDVVSVQVRRGDYLNYPTIHPVITKEYLEQAMSLFPGKDFMFFSDEIKWCEDNFKHRKDCHFDYDWDEVNALVNASCCEHNISSNSSFGWWIYWLNRNPNKKGVFPRKWFGEAMDHDTKDLYIPGSIIL